MGGCALADACRLAPVPRTRQTAPRAARPRARSRTHAPGALLLANERERERDATGAEGCWRREGEMGMGRQEEKSE